MITRALGALVSAYAVLHSHRSGTSAARKVSSALPANRDCVSAVIHCGNFHSGSVSCGAHPALRSELWRAGTSRSQEARRTVGPEIMRRNERRGGRNSFGGSNSDCVAARTSAGAGITRASPGDVVRQGWVQLSERVTLRPGDRVRVSGGPYWEQPSPDGGVTRTRMGERGVMVFEEYCRLGQSQWVVARGESGYAALHVGPEERSAEVPGLVRRPYRLRRIRASESQRKSTRASACCRSKPRSRRRPAHRQVAP